MTLKKITIDDSVRYIPQSEKTKEQNFRQNTKKGGSLLRKQNKNFLQNNKNFLENIAAQGFGFLK